MTDPIDSTPVPVNPDVASASTSPAESAPPIQATQAQGLHAQASTEDWTQTLPEQAHAAATDTKSTSAIFPPLDAQPPADAGDIDMVMDIPVQLSVELGRTRLTIKNILQLGQGSVVELDGMAGEPMDICVNGYLIAQGEVVVVDEKYGVRVTDIITPADRLHRLNQRR